MTHVLQALTSLDENTTVVSIDGVGAFDLISRVSGLMAMENGDRMWPFIREFCGRPSSFLWEDEQPGSAHEFEGNLRPVVDHGENFRLGVVLWQVSHSIACP